MLCIFDIYYIYGFVGFASQIKIINISNFNSTLKIDTTLYLQIINTVAQLTSRLRFIGNGKNLFSKKIEYKEEEAKDFQENNVVRQSET